MSMKQIYEMTYDKLMAGYEEWKERNNIPFTQQKFNELFKEGIPVGQMNIIVGQPRQYGKSLFHMYISEILDKTLKSEN